MKEHVLKDLSPLANVKHFVACFMRMDTDEIYWANRCKCGSDLDEKHRCKVYEFEQGQLGKGAANDATH
jgi:hypothetical protein